MAKQESVSSNNSSATTHFGFKDVKESEKAPLVQGLFSSVAGKYDIMNDAMSMGIHRLWKDAVIDVMKPKRGFTYLDVAGGTGDIAFRISDYLNSDNSRVAPGAYIDDPSRILVCDITEGMLVEGRERAAKRRDEKTFSWVTGDAMSLALPDNSVDVYTIAFGLRNVVRPQEALEEAMRVLRPGGRFFCLEFSKVVLPMFDKAYDYYSFNLLPKLGQWIAGDADSYLYLAESIRKFPTQDKLASMMRDAGMSQVKYQNMTGGIVALHSGWKL